LSNPFPDIYPSLDYFWVPEADQTVLDLANRSRQVNQHSPYDRRRFTMHYGMEDDHTMWEVLMPHYDAHKGERFSFFDFWRIPWPREIHVATGDESTSRFALPAKEVEGAVVRVGGIVIPALAATLFVGTGPEGEDEIQLSAVAPAGADITFTASYARRKFTVWYDGGASAPATVKPVPVEGGLWGLELALVEDIGS
jgi:hypothetical protein